MIRVDGVFEIRRRAPLYYVIGLVAAVLMVLFGIRAYTEHQPLLWILVAALAVLAYLHLVAASDSATPLFVADHHGVRLRDGNQWVGFLWRELGDIRVERRDGVRFDPRIKVLTDDGAQIYTAPLGFTTTMSPHGAETQLAALRPPTSY